MPSFRFQSISRGLTWEILTLASRGLDQILSGLTGMKKPSQGWICPFRAAQNCSLCAQPVSEQPVNQDLARAA